MRLWLGCQLSANRRNLSHAFAADNWKNCRFYGPLHWEIGGQLVDPRNVPAFLFPLASARIFGMRRVNSKSTNTTVYC